jgi:hypothetical protein
MRRPSARLRSCLRTIPVRIGSSALIAALIAVLPSQPEGLTNKIDNEFNTIGNSL